MDKCAFYDGLFARNSEVPETEWTPAVKFSYKPLSIEQQDRYAANVNSGASNASLQLIAQNVIEWDLCKPDGSQVDHEDISSLKKCDPHVTEYILNAIIGNKIKRELYSEKN